MDSSQARKILTATPGSYRWDAIRAAQAVVLAELAAAQAAIQRERERHAPEIGEHEDMHGISEVEYCGYDGHSWPCPTVRALDGDTTEEGR